MTPETLAAAGAELRRLVATAAPDDPAFALLVLLAGGGIGLLLALLLRRSLRPRGEETSLRPAQRLARNLRSAVAYRLPGILTPLAAAAALELAGMRAATPAAFLAETALALAAIYQLAVGLFPLLAHPFEPDPAFPSDDHPAVRGLWWAGRGVLVLIGLGLILKLADHSFDPAPPLRQATLLLATLAAAPVLWRLRSPTGWRRLARTPTGAARHGAGLVIGFVAVAGTLLAPGLPLLAAAGYGDLAGWLLFNILVSVVVLLAAGGIASGLGRGVRRLATTPSRSLEKVLAREHLTPLFGFVAAMLRGAAVLAGVVGVLALWQFPLGRTWQALEPLLFGFRVGEYELSLLALAAAGGVVAGTVYFGRRLRDRMYAGVLTRVTADDGLRNSIASLLYYTIIVAGLLLAVAVAGFDLTNLALIAGALSVGIGFGLQNVVNNFVSGLILLFERPIKVGDIVEYAGNWAEVRDIRVRSTVVRTFDRADLIVPNSELVSATVTNWSHSDRKVRVILPVRVAYGTDPDRVRDLLLQTAAEHPAVLDNPGPIALFRDFGESGLVFEARFFVDVDDYVTAPSDVRYRLVELFRAEGIAIPYPQRDVHLHQEGAVGEG